LKNSLIKIGFGGGCHWCTEAVFQSLKGVEEVEQGFIASTNENESYSEAVIVHFDTEMISLKILTEIHLLTHKSTSDHSMRNKYRSAIYTFSQVQEKKASALISEFQINFENKIITKVLPFREFKESETMFLNYYYSNPEKPFCETFINPKLSLLLKKFSHVVNQQKMKKLEAII
tara:strand:+ start:32598 stop:33122 length:525 start_codon:yes stop_codon:yes gene_type:complete